MIRSGICITVLLVFVLTTTCHTQQYARLSIHYTESAGMAIVIQHTLHADYGCAYPLTYKIDIPPGSSDLAAYERFSASDGWTAIQTKTDSDFFNGIEAVRYDYPNDIAYVSAAFSPESDTLCIKIVNQSGNMITPGFEGISRYYDNRRAVVTISDDDWEDWSVTDDNWYIPLLHLFRSDSLYVSIGVITQDCSSTTWKDLQLEVDSGYVEVASHSRTHPPTPYPDPTGEIGGSRDDILKNLVLPPPFSSNGKGYVYTWLAPYGDYDSTVDSLLGVYDYLDARLYANLDTTAPREYFYGDSTLASWNAERNHFAPFFPTVELGAPSWGGGDTSLASLNGLFDSIMSKGDVYHLMWHPQTLTTDIDSSYLLAHLSHISRRKNIWYANLGIVYLYRMLQEENSSHVERVEEVSGAPLAFELSQNYPNPFNPATVISYQLPLSSAVTLKVYDVLGREVQTLANGREGAGIHAVTFGGENLPSGVYFCRLSAQSLTGNAADYEQTKKMVLVK